MPPADPLAARASPAAPVPLRIEHIAGSPHFVPLASVTGIAVDLRYAGVDNFAARNLYGTLDCAWLRREAARGLAEAARCLQRERPGWRIVVLDALRPQRVQEAIWADIAGTDLQDYFAPPGEGSIHSFGMAVDVTLLDPAGCEAGRAEMGSGFDEMNRLSHPALHDEHLASGMLTREQVALRACLARAMAAGGFAGIETEWWHFDHGDREAVRRAFARVL